MFPMSRERPQSVREVVLLFLRSRREPSPAEVARAAASRVRHPLPV
jgi:hypothetical protein